mmetsp:Transcript_54044/g.173292  ORF Transcript_54044/g.173292 Transcript_54044/m.173292 type:complete len:236 (+) Transcript_54044:155-862(+)
MLIIPDFFPAPWSNARLARTPPPSPFGLDDTTCSWRWSPRLPRLRIVLSGLRNCLSPSASFWFPSPCSPRSAAAARAPLGAVRPSSGNWLPLLLPRNPDGRLRSDPKCTSAQPAPFAAEPVAPKVFEEKRAFRSRLPWKAATSANRTCNISCWAIRCWHVGISISFTDLMRRGGVFSQPSPGPPFRSVDACSLRLAERSASPSPTETKLLNCRHSRWKAPFLNVMGECIGLATIW